LWKIRDHIRGIALFCHPRVTAAIKQAYIFVSVELKDPQCKGCPPVGLITIDDDGVIALNALRSHQRGKARGVYDITRVLIQKLGMEINPRSGRNMPDVVEQGVFIDLDDTQTLNA